MCFNLEAETKSFDSVIDSGNIKLLQSRTCDTGVLIAVIRQTIMSEF